MEDPACGKMTLKGYLERQKATPRGPGQASICDELGVRMCCSPYLVQMVDQHLETISTALNVLNVNGNHDN